MLPIGGVLQARTDVFLRQIWEVSQNLFIRHAGRQVLENIVDGDPHAPDARLPASLAGLDRDDVPIALHERNLPSSDADVDFVHGQRCG